MSFFLEDILGYFHVELRKELRLEALSLRLVAGVISLQAVVLGYILFGTVECAAPVGWESYFLNDTLAVPLQWTVNDRVGPYVNLTCGTEVKLNAVYLYFCIIGYIVCLACYGAVVREFVTRSNILSAYIAGDSPANCAPPDPDQDYVTQYLKACKRLRWFKTLFIPIIVTGWAAIVIGVAYNSSWRELLTPQSNPCIGGGKFNVIEWNDQTEAKDWLKKGKYFKCHFSSEFQILVLGAICVAVQAIMNLVFLLSIFELRRFMRKEQFRLLREDRSTPLLEFEERRSAGLAVELRKRDAHVRK